MSINPPANTIRSEILVNYLRNFTLFCTDPLFVECEECEVILRIEMSKVLSLIVTVRLARYPSIGSVHLAHSCRNEPRDIAGEIPDLYWQSMPALIAIRDAALRYAFLTEA